ncbi:hypothetical protein [Antarctobacter jejuensis]|uniref:hypothetical protein n=1 Tax=Antarctobacter jejuensis TaxID=1439938 RepID=UPI003FD08CB9
MNKTHALIDKRTLDPHWRDVFRLRLTGWLPAGDAENATKRGTISRGPSSVSCQVELTELGRALTDFDGFRLSDGTVSMIVNVFQTREITCKVLQQRSDDGVSLSAEDIFPDVIRERIFHALAQEEARQVGWDD